MGSKFLMTTGRWAFAMALAISLQSVCASGARAAANSSNAGTAVPVCGLPVCDIDAKLEQISQLPQGDRFKAIASLRKQYKKSQNQAEWENLLAFAEKAAALFVNLQEEDWMIGEAQGLADDAVMALLKFSQPIELERLLFLFKKISNENRRFEALKYWSETIPKLEDREALSALLKFGGQAQKVVLTLEDAEWVGEEAARVASLATARLVAMDPSHEGVFEIQGQCAGSGCANYPKMKNMIVMETTNKNGGQGLVITFPLEFGGTPAYSFYYSMFRDGPDQVVASSSPAGLTSPRPAELKVSFDRVTGEVKGVLRDTRSTTSWKFKGKPVSRVIAAQTRAVRGETPSIEELPGIYQVNVGGTNSQLVIRETMEGGLYASLVNDNYTLDFKIGQYLPSKSFLSLVYIGANQNIVKVALKFDKVSGIVTASGISYTSRNPTVSQWRAKRLGPVEEEDYE